MCYHKFRTMNLKKTRICSCIRLVQRHKKCKVRQKNTAAGDKFTEIKNLS